MSRTPNHSGRRQVYVAAPLAHQIAVIDDPHRYKAGRCGRRWGKSRTALRACILGHGPVINGRRLYPGLAHGGSYAWVGPDYPQTKAIWEEEIKPRFGGAFDVKVNDSDRVLRIGGGFARLEMRSAENIDGMRGKKNDGVVVDEAAFLGDFNYAWRRVIRPTLIDKGGWAFIISSPDSGSDFNRLIREIENGERPPSWMTWRGRTRDNSALPPEEVEAAYADYPPGSTDAMQELEAELVDEHGELFKKEYFQYYERADKHGMYVDGVFHPFVELHMYVDLASSMKQMADYTAVMIVGFTPRIGGVRKAGVLHIENQHIEGPAQIDLFADMLDFWQPSFCGVEAVQYQATAVQHLKSRRPRFKIKEIHPDKDKRTRAVPWAAAMARGDVFWNKHAAWMDLTMKQHLKFPNGKEASQYPDDHDDIVDTGSMAAVNLVRSKIKAPMLPTTGKAVTRNG